MKKTLLFLFGLSAIDMFGQHCSPLDSTFGTAGSTFGYSATGSNGPPYSRNLIVQPDNKIIQTITAVTGSRYQFGLIRYNPNGKLDSSFGTNGRITATVGNIESSASASALQSDGKIVSVGSAVSSGYSSGFALVRYTSNGKVDSSFGQNGRVITQVGAYSDYARAIAIQSDGKILVAGSSYDGNYTQAFTILRYNSNGSPDISFAQNGVLITHPGPLIDYIGDIYFGRYADEYASALLLQPDGKILVGGTSYTHSGCWDYYGGLYCNPAFAILRLNNNGAIDSSFGINGKIIDSVNLTYAQNAVLQTDGKIVITGSGYNTGIMIGRFNSNGTRDSSFGDNGIRTLEFSSGGSSSVAIQDDEKIVVAGTIGYDLTVARYLSDGSLDNSFNNTGAVAIQLGEAGSTNYATGVGIQGDKIIVGATNQKHYTEASIVIARVPDNGQPFTPVINANGPLQFCNGNTVKLSVSDADAVQWYQDNNALAGAIDTSLLVFSSGWYKVRVTNALGCAFSAPQLVSTYNAFTPAIFANGNTNFCTGDSVNLVSNAYSQWYKDGTAMSGSLGHSLFVKESGTYTAKTNYNGCESQASNGVTVTVNDVIPPAPVISAGGNTAFCSGENVLLSSNAASGNQWYRNGGLITGATASSFAATSAGTYTAKVSLGACQSSTSNSITTTVYSLPTKPVLTWSTPDLSTAPGYIKYQWYLNNNLISGVDTNVYRATQTGTYKVVVTGNNDCTNYSDEFVLRVLGASEIQIGDSKLRYYPNPVRSTLNIDVNDGYRKGLTAKIYDASGRLVHRQSLVQGQNQLELKALPMGFYQLMIHNDAKTVAVKFIKAL